MASNAELRLWQAPAPRVRLLDDLDAWAGNTRACVLWIGAPAGSGKTTLIEQWTPPAGTALVRLPLDACDADPAVFLARLRAALTPLHRTGAAPVFTREHLAQPVAYARALCQALADGPPCVVAVDDAHHLPAELDGLWHLAANGHLCQRWLVGSRDRPPRALQRAVNAGRALVMDGARLALTRDECAAWLRTQGADPAQADALHARTGGWAGAVVALASAVPIDAAGAGAGPPHPVLPEALYRYIEAEVFAALPPREQEVLLACCHLPRVKPGWAAQLAGTADAHAVYARLAQRQLLVHERNDDAEAVYVPHALLTEFLQRRAARHEAPMRVREQRRRSAALLADAGCPEQALALALAAQDWSHANRLVAQIAPAAIAAARHRSVARWAATIPAPERDAWTWFWLGQGTLLEDPATGRAHLVEALDGFARESASEPQLRALAAIIATYFQEYSDATPLGHWLERLQRLAPDVDTLDDDELRGQLIVAVFSALLLRDPAHRELPRWIERLEALFAQPIDPNVRARGAMLLAKHWWYTGRYERLRLLTAQAVPDFRDPRCQPYAHLVWRLAQQYECWAQADPARGRRLMVEALAFADACGIHLLDNHLRIYGACFALVEGDLAAARALLEAVARTVSAARVMEHWQYAFALSWLQLESGAFEVAADAARVALAAGRRMGPAPTCFGLVALAQAQAAAQPGSQAPTLRELRVLAQATGNAFACWQLELLAHAGEGAAATRLWTLAAKHGLLVMPLVRRSLLAERAAQALALRRAPVGVERTIRAWRLLPPAAFELDARWPRSVRIRTLGAFDVRGEDGTRHARASARLEAVLQALIALLPADGSGSVAVDALADALWPDADGDAARHALEMNVHRLRAWLGAAALQVRNARISLSPTACWVDAWDLARQLAQIEHRLARAESVEPASIDQVLATYRGEFLPDSDAPWVCTRREQLRGRFARTLGQLGTAAGDRIEPAVRALIMEFGRAHPAGRARTG